MSKSNRLTNKINQVIFGDGIEAFQVPVIESVRIKVREKGKTGMAQESLTTVIKGVCFFNGVKYNVQYFRNDCWKILEAA